MKSQIVLIAASVVLGAFILNYSALGNNEGDEAVRAVNQYKVSQRWFERFSIRMISTYRSISPVNVLGPSDRVQATITKLGSCLSITAVRESLSQETVKRSDSIHIVTNHSMSMFEGHETRSRPNGASVSTKVVEKLQSNITDFLINGSILEGYMLECDGKCLADIVLESGDLSFLGKESINGYPCPRILARTKYGTVELWLDEQNGYLPRKYVYKKEADDLCNGGIRLRDLKFGQLGQGEFKGVFMNGASRVLDQVEIGKTAGFYFMSSGRISATDSLSNGKSSSYESMYKRTEFDPAPKLSENDFKIDLPNGFLINNEDDPNSGVVYEWRDGEIVPAYSAFSGTAEGKWSSRSMIWIATWLVTGLVLLVFALRYIWRYKQKGA